ncbi:hypothetical protein [Pontibacter cellulosilyticus]|uniref:YtkA-like domain-containing protein n=1 Tax=Pontibacter cellulosilyticus TaxID=1720253 RepID=A0A923N7R5_9BACT|nr:hypothetical protein [Pontibacter cellulosilyticus]MBC5993314.1 hypothetical protein [Pontibacter cellulosilyticus]
MVRILCIFTLLLCTAFSCSKETDTVKPTVLLSKIIEVDAPESGKINEVITMKVKYTLSSGCVGFKGLEEERAGNTYTIKAYLSSDSDPNRICHQAAMYGYTDYTFTPTQVGTYTFNFYQDPENSITKTITITDGTK